MLWHSTYRHFVLKNLWIFSNNYFLLFPNNVSSLLSAVILFNSSQWKSICNVKHSYPQYRCFHFPTSDSNSKSYHLSFSHASYLPCHWYWCTGKLQILEGWFLTKIIPSLKILISDLNHLRLLCLQAEIWVTFMNKLESTF